MQQVVWKESFKVAETTRKTLNNKTIYSLEIVHMHETYQRVVSMTSKFIWVKIFRKFTYPHELCFLEEQQ